MRACQGQSTGRRSVARHLVGLLVAVLAIVLPLLPPGGAPVAAGDDSAGSALARINAARAAIGVPPLKRNPALDTAASAHANYYRMNFGDPALAGTGLHYEEPGKPGFTGADFAARAKAAGYSGSVNENIGLSGDLLVSVEWFMGTVNHRLTLLDPRYSDVGFGAVNDDKIKIEVIDVGTIVWRGTIEPAWEPWPPPDGVGIALRFDGEAPNPFPGATYPLGYPITLKYNGAGTVAFTGARLTQGNQPVAVIARVGTGFITRNTYLIAATTALSAGTTYTIAIEGTLDGKAFTRTWSFTTKDAPGAPPAATLPPGVAALDPAAISRWRAADHDVYLGKAARTWTWGPDVLVTRQEPYAEAAGSVRTVYYFDKSRMEINDPNGDRTSPWFVTNGLLVREMIAGQVQVGDGTFHPREPATLTVAGDPVAQNPGAATYASLAGVASLTAGENAVPQRVGLSVAETVDAAGVVSHDASLEGVARYGAYDATFGHNIADVFWGWLAAQPVEWVYAVGYPLTEPYWTLTKVRGADTWVLVQAFERRVLTFVPGNAAAWQVEAGNVGRHYYEWRYDTPLR